MQLMQRRVEVAHPPCWQVWPIDLAGTAHVLPPHELDVYRRGAEDFACPVGVLRGRQGFVRPRCHDFLACRADQRANAAITLAAAFSKMFTGTTSLGSPRLWTVVDTGVPNSRRTGRALAAAKEPLASKDHRNHALSWEAEVIKGVLRC